MCARGRTEGLTLDGVECSALGLGEPGEVHWAEMNERAAPVVVQADDRRLAFVAASVLKYHGRRRNLFHTARRRA
jgi:hypothetical protein